MRRAAGLVLALGLTASACSGPDDDLDGFPVAGPPSGLATPTTTPTTPPAPEPAPRPTRVSPDDLRPATAVAAVAHLAGEVGPRPGHTAAYRRAAAWAEGELASYGWTVRRQRFSTPAGVSWGVPVEAGPSVNLVATQGEARPGGPWLLVGAHLDTVPQAPGAEDNASGVGLVLAVAEALEQRRARLPVTLVLFGSEEPRGPGDAHHYGSKAYVASLSPAERRGLRGMVSLDRVGVGSVVPVQTVGEANAVSRELLAAARRAGVPTEEQAFETSSDHESFTDDGLPAARLGSTPYAGYHSPQDVPAVVEREQLARVGRIVLGWLR
ncbi:M28 family metallopeptidase [Nocardioides litoris]|uniref:M28 family metallopeptidase n=1 Tax=Nocardioides litoris TaxID=1926648 RepID=UPI00111DE17B|nr:M28 family peptidase [Nocardioides litoris]